MFFKFILLITSLAFSVVLAHHPSQHSNRMVSHRGKRQLSHNRREQDDNIWAGSVVEGAGQSFSHITGTFIAPQISGSTWDAVAFWVGVDGNICQSGLFQAGVDAVVAPDGVQYNAWFEWYPAPSIYPSDFLVSTGDSIKVTLDITSTTSGNAMIENLNTGRNVSQTLTNPDAPLCGNTVEWIAEDYTSGSTGMAVSLANFGTMTFTDAVATGPGKEIYTPATGSIYNIVRDKQVLTSVSSDGSSATIQRL